MNTKPIFCCGCGYEIPARLTSGKEVYPHLPHLHRLHFWKCHACGNSVGCHKGSKKHAPLGCIPTPEIKRARRHIHRLLDPLWKSGKVKRRVIYEHLSEKLGYRYHTADLRDIDEARRVYRLVREMAKLG